MRNVGCAWKAPSSSALVSAMFVLLALAAAALVFPPQAEAGEWKLESADGESHIKFGFMVQMRAESLETADGEDSAQDLYFRRLRILFGGQIAPKWTFFGETDSPNLGKGESDGTKGSSDVFIQDFFVSYNHANELKVDFGMILIPFSHNSLNSAFKLLPTDYGPYSFLNSGPTDSRVGRDYGAQVRGYLFDDSLEYRAGVFQGDRGNDSTESFRYAGRVVYYPFEADKGFFYTGTTLGKKKILALGLGFDTQDDYTAWSADVFYDQPLAGGDGVTIYLARHNYDGDDFFIGFPEQDITSLELGYYFGGSELMPYGAWYERDYDEESLGGSPLVDEERFEVGLAWYPAGYNRQVKISYGQIRPDVGEERDRFMIQLQVLQY